MNINAIIDAVCGPLKRLLFPEDKFPQHTPTRLMIGCIDARMPVAMLGFAPGSTLIKRNIAALVPKSQEEAGVDMAATLEFAIKGKNIKEIVVMGHTDCGGIGACIDHNHTMPEVTKYLTPLHPVRDAMVGGDRETKARSMEIAAVCMSLENLLTYRCVKEAVDRGELQLKGRLLDVRNNKVYDIDTKHGLSLTAVPDTLRTTYSMSRDHGRP